MIGAILFWGGWDWGGGVGGGKGGRGIKPSTMQLL